MNQLPSAFWCVSVTEILQHLGTAKEGLSSEEARQRLARYGSNLLQPQKRSNALTLLLAQFKSPLILILLFATGLSFSFHDPVNALIILTIVLASGLLGFWQEHSATTAVEKLLAMVQIKATVLHEAACITNIRSRPHWLIEYLRITTGATWAQELDERGQQVNGKEEYVPHNADGTTTSVTCKTARRSRLTA